MKKHSYCTLDCSRSMALKKHFCLLLVAHCRGERFTFIFGHEYSLEVGMEMKTRCQYPKRQ